ncbi:hypothetical protein DSO57_1011054 [Entomophthora muscae]|uniref:Uncharacterized protein n=1 Tax=Entomophthora muscae TaxID=34485 RepID=A0ACC2TTS2_9FUNG|nr:hypothetical protein DSO57_1011054 [Entomophthora muscae]
MSRDSWERKIPTYTTVNLNHIPQRYAVTLLSHFFKTSPSVGFVEVTGNQLCVSQWDFKTNKITIELRNSSEAIYFIHKNNQH